MLGPKLATESTVSEAPRRGRPGPTGREGERAPRGTPHTPTPHAHTHAKAEERTAPGPHPTRGTPTRRPDGTRKAEAKRRRAGAALKGAEPETKPQGGRNRKGPQGNPKPRAEPKAKPTEPRQRPSLQPLTRATPDKPESNSRGAEPGRGPHRESKSKRHLRGTRSQTEPEARPTKPHRKAYQPTTPTKAPKPTRPTYAKPEGTPRGSGPQGPRRPFETETEPKPKPEAEQKTKTEK